VVSSPRTARRKTRYSELRALGYSARDARRLRDVGDTRRIIVKEQTVARISEIPARRRTPEERQLRRNIIREQRVSVPTVRLSTTARLNRFRRWSRTRQFPTEIQEWIERQNLQSGRDLNDSFGYRLFYHRFVDDMSAVEAFITTERRDT
jgi:hypothetical protein